MRQILLRVCLFVFEFNVGITGGGNCDEGEFY